MRGYDRPQTTMLTLVSPEKRGPANNPSVGLAGKVARAEAVVAATERKYQSNRDRSHGKLDERPAGRKQLQGGG